MNKKQSFFSTIVWACGLLMYRTIWPHKKLTSTQKKTITKQWQTIEAITAPTQQIIEAEKLFVSTLRILGYSGTFAEQWKQAEKRYGSNQTVWNAHKLRNRIVHEAGVQATKKDAQFVVKTYKNQLRLL